MYISCVSLSLKFSLSDHQSQIPENTINNDNANHDANKLTVTKTQAVLVGFNDHFSFYLTLRLQIAGVHAVIAATSLDFTVVDGGFELIEH